MTLLTVAVVYILLSSTCGQDDVVYPTMYQYQRLATRINCQVSDSQHFHYSSTTELWGAMGGQIVVEADVTLLCLGDDSGGKYESEALKYRAQVTNLQITEKKISDTESLRRKRGVRDYFSESWDKVKKFFKRVFGPKTREPEVTKASGGGNVDEKISPPVEEESEEEIKMADYEELYSTPFQFVQLANGSIPEIRFSENEIDGRVKNFKRHLVDAFSTQLNFEQRQKAIVEKSVMGEHTSTYNITSDEPAVSSNIASLSKLKLKTEEPSVVVKKFVSEGDILTLAPSDALNDRGRMDLKVEQIQVFQGGRMISSNGISSLILLPNAEEKSNRIKREGEEDLTAHLQTHSSFDIQLQRRQKRSVEQTQQLEKDGSYSPASRIAEVEDNSERRNIQLFREMNVDIAELIGSLAEGKDSDYDEKMQALFELVEREVSLRIDKDDSSISKKINGLLSKEMLHSLCSRNFSICKDFLQLLALIGGADAENVLLSFVTEKNELPSTHKQTVVNIISDISAPSKNLLQSLIQNVEQNSLDSDALGAVCLSLGHLASKSSADIQSSVSQLFANLLKDRHGTCRSDPLVIDLLEAIGNLHGDHAVSEVLKVSELCSDNGAIQIACAHALRHSIHLEKVQDWINKTSIAGDCDILSEVVGALTDKIQDQEMTPDIHLWPRFGFNAIDNHLMDHLVNSRCSMEDILLYFRRKNNPEANEIARNYFGQGSEPWNPKHPTRQKRAAWDDLNCQEWTEDNNYTPIQDKEEFASDRATYNKRKSCLAFRRLGVKGANTEVYAGMFAGVKDPSDPPKYKLFTKFVSGLNFLGHQMEIGSFYFYHQSGRTKAFVRIMGRTRQEVIHEGCTPTDLTYRPLKHIPLYLINLGAVQLTLGIHLSSQLSMDTVCPGKDVYQLEPLTNVRIGGEAMGNILFARAAANLGGNFNYKLQFTFSPSPDMCLKGSHGYDPMSISFEAYYQLWNSVKRNWGKPRIWKPNFLSWNVIGGNMKQWFDDICIASSSSSSSINLEREME